MSSAAMLARAQERGKCCQLCDEDGVCVDEFCGCHPAQVENDEEGLERSHFYDFVEDDE